MPIVGNNPDADLRGVYEPAGMEPNERRLPLDDTMPASQYWQGNRLRPVGEQLDQPLLAADGDAFNAYTPPANPWRAAWGDLRRWGRRRFTGAEP